MKIVLIYGKVLKIIALFVNFKTLNELNLKLLNCENPTKINNKINKIKSKLTKQ